MNLARFSALLLFDCAASQDYAGLMITPNQALSMSASKPLTVLSLGSDDPLGIAGHYGGSIGKDSSTSGSLLDWSNFHSLLGGHTSLASVRHSQNEHPDWSSVLDPFMKDILEMMNAGLTQEVLPKNQTVKPCTQDIVKLCPEGEKLKSPLQCLGQNAGKITDECKKDVKASLPYNCALEISNGCDGLEKPIVTCLSELDKTKPLSKDCKNTLDITKTVIHKVNTAPVTVLDLQRLNDTHIAATQTTNEAHPPVWWECPAGFEHNGGTGLAQQEMPCCSATPEMKEPKPACAAGSGQWNLASHIGAHGGMECCPHMGMMASESHSRHIPIPVTTVQATIESSHNWVLIVMVLAFVSALMSQALKLLNPKAAAALSSMLTRGMTATQSQICSRIGQSGKKFDGPVGKGQAHPSATEMIKRGTPPRKERADVYEETEFDL